MKKEQSIKKHIEKIINPIFQAALPKELKQNRMSVGVQGNKERKYCLYQPHNLRLYFDFSKQTFNPQTDLKSSVQPLLRVEHKIKNKIENEYNNFLGYRITVKQTQVELIDLNPRWYVIYLDKIDLITEQFLSIMARKIKENKKALNKFIKIYGGSSKLNLLNMRSENKVMNEDAIDLIPIKMKFRSEAVKKVYNEKNVEFPDPILASNYLTTRAVENKADKITDGINSIHTTISDKLTPVLNKLTAQIELHLEVQRNTLINTQESIKTQKDIQNLMKSFNPPKIKGKPVRKRKYGLSNWELRIIQEEARKFWSND